MGNSVLGKNIGEVKPYNVSPTDPNYIPPTAMAIGPNTASKITSQPAGYTAPQFTNIGSVRYNYNGGQQHQGGMVSPPSFVSTTPPADTGWYGTDLTGAMNALNQSNGKYLLGSNTLKPGQFGYDYDDSRTGRGAPQTTYFLYDNPDYQAPPQQQATTEPSYTTDANGNPVNNGTTAGTMTSTITLDPHQQYLLNQQNAAKEQLTNALADYTGNVFNKAFNPQSEVGNPLSFRDAMGQIKTTDLSGDYKAANDFLSGASSVFDPAARAFANQLAYGKIPESDWAYRKQIQDALMDYQESRLNPTYAKQADQLATKLANQGITQGSDTYGSEWDIYNRAKNDAYQNAYNNAITLGEQAIQNQFNRDLAAYQQVGQNYNLAAQMKDLATDNLHNVYNLDVQQNAAANSAALGLMNASTNQVQQKYQQSLATRQQQMNELMTLMNLTAPTNPTFSHQQTAGNVAPGDQIGATTGLYSGLGGAAANGAAQQQAAQQSQSNFLGDLIGAAGLFGFGKLFG